MSLHPVAGHEEARRALARAHGAGSLPHALLFHGLQGVGKQRMALWTAQLQVCEHPTAEGPCGSCRECRMALKLEHPDLHWYFPLPRPKGVSGDRLADALESDRVDALAELRNRPLRPSWTDGVRGLYLGTVQNIRRRAHVRPTQAPVQTFIISDAELLVPQEASPEAANALLKLLEEPPEGTRFILTSSEPGRLLPTIRSRAVPFHLGTLPFEEVVAFLTEHTDADGKTASWAARLGQGSIGRALGFLPEPGDDGDERGPLETLRRDAWKLVDAALAEDRATGFAAALSRPPAGARELIPLFAFVEEWLRDLAAVAVGAGEGVLSPDAREHLAKVAEEAELQPVDLAGALTVLEEAREAARGNVNPQLIVSGVVRELRRALKPMRPAAGASP